LPREHSVADEPFIPLPVHSTDAIEFRPIPARLPLTQVNTSGGTASRGRL